MAEQANDQALMAALRQALGNAGVLDSEAELTYFANDVYRTGGVAASGRCGPADG